MPKKSEVRSMKHLEDAGVVILITGSLTVPVVLGPWRARVVNVSLIKWWLHWRCRFFTRANQYSLRYLIGCYWRGKYPPAPHFSNWILKTWPSPCRDGSTPSRSSGIGSVSMTPRYNHCFSFLALISGEHLNQEARGDKWTLNNGLSDWTILFYIV